MGHRLVSQRRALHLAAVRAPRRGHGKCRGSARRLRTGRLENADTVDRGTFAFSVAPRSGGHAELIVGKYFWFYMRQNGSWKVAREIMSLDEGSDGATP
jgi:hypothetical protein